MSPTARRKVVAGRGGWGRHFQRTTSAGGASSGRHRRKPQYSEPGKYEQICSQLTTFAKTSTPPPLCHPRSRFLPLPLCGACPFVGYCGLFSINYFHKIGAPARRVFPDHLITFTKPRTTRFASQLARPLSRPRGTTSARSSDQGTVRGAGVHRTHVCGARRTPHASTSQPAMPATLAHSLPHHTALAPPCWLRRAADHDRALYPATCANPPSPCAAIEHSPSAVPSRSLPSRAWPSSQRCAFVR